MNYYDKNNSDYAICKIDSFKSTAVTFSNKYSNGNTVFALGFPNNSNTIKTTEGKVVNKEIEANKKIKYIENDAKIDHGSSGGIFSDKYGNVIGITTCELDRKHDKKNAIKISVLIDKDDPHRAEILTIFITSKIK